MKKILASPAEKMLEKMAFVQNADVVPNAADAER